MPTAQNRAEIEERVRKLTRGITLDDGQLDRIVGFPSYRWARDSIARVIEEIEALGQQIVEHEAILADPKRIRGVYKREVQALLKLTRP